MACRNHSLLFLFFLAMVVSPAIRGESQFRYFTPSSVKDQGPTHWCPAFCLAGFVESWGNGNRLSATLPPLDPGFIALSYNLEAAAGDEGMFSQWLAAIIQRWGILPEGAVRASDGKVPPLLANWTTSQLHLQDPEALKEVLLAKYRHPSEPNSFTAKEYLAKTVGLNFRGFELVQNQIAKVKNQSMQKAHSLGEWAAPYTEYRYPVGRGNYAETLRHLQSLGPIPVLESPLLFASISERIIHLLEHGRPVPTGLKVGRLKRHFRVYYTIRESDLMAQNDAPSVNHSILAIAYCHEKKGNPLCEKFAAKMQAARIKSGFIFRNTGGKNANLNGDVLIDERVFSDLLDFAFLAPPEN